MIELHGIYGGIGERIEVHGVEVALFDDEEEVGFGRDGSIEVRFDEIGALDQGTPGWGHEFELEEGLHR